MTLIELPDAGIHPGQWRLARIEVVNWGTFQGHTAIEVARKGHLFTGASGSGKSSLLDAIATVLTPSRWLRFNAAAQESTARNDDRSMVSYVRGAWSKEADAELDRAVSSYLRTGATWSGILLRYENLVDPPVTLVRLFHIRGGSVDRGELKDLAFVDRGEIDLLEFHPHVASGIDARRIKAAWPSAVTTTNGSHKAYFSRITRLLGIGSAGGSGGTENALHLLHKTQSAKNLGSLDHLFRAFMLDEPTTFARAANAVEQFGELNEAHRLVVEAREQLDALTALDPSILQYENALQAASSAERLAALIDVFEQRLLIALTDDDLAETRSLHARAEDHARRAARTAADAHELARLAALRSSELGGAEADRARERADAARQLALDVETRWRRFVEELAAVGLSAPQDAHEFAELQDAARRELDESSRADGAVLHEHEENRAYFEAKREVEKIDRELAELRQRKSNLPAPLLVARRWLADELGVDETVLPFAGELIEVKSEFAEWTGAIERVLHPLAATMLVRDEHLARVRRLADTRHFGTRLRFEAVPAIADSPRPARSPRSLLGRIAVGNGPFAGWLQWRLAEQFDYACVDHVDELDDVERGVTLAGQVKASARRYEKNDAVRVDDRRHWILGADNAEKIETLLEQRRNADGRLRAADGRLKQVQASRDAELKRRSQLGRLLNQPWSEVDRAAAAEIVRARQAQLEAVTTGNAELNDAIALEQEATQRADAAELADREADAERRRLAGVLDELEAALARLNEQRESTQIDERDSVELDRRYRALQRRLDRVSVPTIGRKVLAELNTEARTSRERAESARSTFEHGAYAFRSRWPVPAADLTTTIDDRAGFRALRTEIEARGLPEHEQRFLRLLREKSQELIGHLLADIRDAPKQVRERIDPVNASLSHSLFDHDRFLEIRVREQRAPEVQRFLDELRSVVEGSWDEVALELAEARFSTLADVMRRLGSSTSEDLLWKQRCLDTREHVTFQAREIDRGGRVVNVHDSSAGLSGGQRQKLVIFCLAAALRYQLTSDDDAPPNYATIVLDEAFDKADSSYTRMAMDVFEAFGFHMLLATPQKLLSTIEPYVGAVTSISNESRKRSTVANVMFEAVSGPDVGDDERDARDARDATQQEGDAA